MSETLVMRSSKKPYWGSDGTTYNLMKTFTSFSQSMNAAEYTRKYIVNSFETTDVTGYSPSFSFALDVYKGDVVTEDISALADGETVGTDAIREIVVVDYSAEATEGAYPAKKRSVSVIMDAIDDGTDASTLTGTLKATTNWVTEIGRAHV